MDTQTLINQARIELLRETNDRIISALSRAGMTDGIDGYTDSDPTEPETSFLTFDDNNGNQFQITIELTHISQEHPTIAAALDNIKHNVSRSELRPATRAQIYEHLAMDEMNRIDTNYTALAMKHGTTREEIMKIQAEYIEDTTNWSK